MYEKSYFNLLVQFPTCSDLTVSLAIGDSAVLDPHTIAQDNDTCATRPITVDPPIVYASDAQQIPVTVYATDNSGNTVTCTSVVTVEILTSNAESMAGNIRSLVPNPAVSQVTLTFNDAPEVPSEVRIHDVSGKLALQPFEADDSSITLNVSALTPGLYHLVIRSGENGSVIGHSRFVIAR